jgi:hypothetical protein
MNTIYPDQTTSVLASCSGNEDSQEQHDKGNFLYQAATILAIVLFLISF